MQVDRGYTDPRLAAAYDLENAGRDDIEFYLALADELGARTVTDLGCGTGVLAADLAATGKAVTGIDPAAAMLDIARRRPGGDRVTWVHGDASNLAPASAQLLVMTGHVAQVFLSDRAWAETLAAAYRAIEPGGHLAFETRNPDARGWLRWTRADSFGRYGEGAFESWVEVTDVAGGLVSFDAHTVFADTGEDVVSASTLRFRSRAEVEASLGAPGFETVAVFGDWTRGPVAPTSPELIFLARRP